jgi:hypothetical protein
MPTKWLQERTYGCKNILGMLFEGPGVTLFRTECFQRRFQKLISTQFRQLTLHISDSERSDDGFVNELTFCETTFITRCVR